MTLYIAGSVFLVLSIIWYFIQKAANRNKKYEEAKRDKQKAIDAHDFNAQLDADRKMRMYK